MCGHLMTRKAGKSGAKSPAVSAPRHINVVKSGAVVRLIIDRPETRNALSLQTVNELQEAVARAESDPDVRVLVLTGAGSRAFASGADLNELTGAMDTPENAARYDTQFGVLYDMLQSARLPVIARIQAHAIGGGCMLALACDFCIIGERATIGVPASRIGLMLSPREHQILVDRVGPSRAKFLLFTGRRLSAREAADWGLVDLVAAADRLDETVDELAREISSRAPLAVKAAKRLVNAARGGVKVDELVEACYREVYTSDDLREGLAAVKERRAPVFKGC